MSSNAKKKSLKLNLFSNFDRAVNIVNDVIPVQRILSEVWNSCSKEELKIKHPMIVYLQDLVDHNHLLPRQAIGDPDRLQQVAINIIQNAIENSYHGKIDIHISYDWDA